MPRFLLLVVFSLLLFRCTIGGMCAREKEGGSSHPQKGSFRKLDDAGQQGKRTKHTFAPGEVLVKFKAGVTREGIDGIQEAYGLSLIKRLESIGVYRFRIPSGSTVEDMVDALNEDAQVEYAEPNYTVGITVK
jgi:hypothetical protein